MSIAEIGRKHLREALTGQMSSCDVSEWKGSDGLPVKIYWKAMTGTEQRQVDEASGEVGRTLMMLKLRARDEKGNLIFEDTPLASLENDFDYDVIRSVVFLMLTGMGQDNRAEQIEKE